jgi:LuxR family maltose regulon positive regulatory protein
MMLGHRIPMTTLGRVLIDRHDLIAALDRAAEKRVTIVSAPAGSGKTSLLHAWVSQKPHVAVLLVRPAQADAQQFWLALLGAVRAATGADEPPPPAPEFDGHAMIHRVLGELANAGDPFYLVIDDLHELGSATGAEQLTELLTSLPHIRHIYAKLGATDRSTAVQRGRELRLLSASR